MCSEKQIKFKDYPDATLAQMMWGEIETESKCVGCNANAKYLIPLLCTWHYKNWEHDRRSFEKSLYHD